ncbi:MAG: hypothetical protein CMM58_02135 [Rhodospirillaceae bacterium]|nr:hypothetical protein [Rhodospirillaceae bacterium]|tara:strand:- start:1201 stop:1605 length:405 start_codon:yes stop_codon:yes gene_type:complete
MKSYIRIIQISIAGLGLLFSSIASQAGTLENLERERAFLIKAFLDPELTVADRLTKLEAAKPRLVDLERMVLRDDSLTGRNTPVVRKAFSNYDLTFLVHSSTESNKSLIDTWLEQLGITTNTVMIATKVQPTME